MWDDLLARAAEYRGGRLTTEVDDTGVRATTELVDIRRPDLARDGGAAADVLLFLGADFDCASSRVLLARDPARDPANGLAFRTELGIRFQITRPPAGRR